VTDDPVSEELLEATYNGNFGLEEHEIVPYICARLGPPDAD
jgi:hypothetical protein